MGVGLIIIDASWLGVMEGNRLYFIHLHLVQKQIVFVPLCFSIDHYLFFVSLPLPNSSQGCESVRLQLERYRMRPQCNYSISEHIISKAHISYVFYR